MPDISGRAVIFDMDGVLYPFSSAINPGFSELQFRDRLRQNALSFFETHFGAAPSIAEALYESLSQRFNGEVSLGLEQEHQVPRAIYFAATWDMDPRDFMAPQPALAEQLGRISVPRAVLSAAPQVWVEQVLKFLDVAHLFDAAIFCGDPDIRKPQPAAFMQVAEHFGLHPTEVVMIGDREETDITPAKLIGMRTVRIGHDSPTQADFVAADLADALNILEREGML